MHNLRSKAVEHILALGIVVLLIFILNPWHWWMPTMQIMTLCVLLFMFMASYALFIVHERPTDEREEYHALLLGRASFLAVAFFLVAGLIWQLIHHSVDPWLVGALAIMVVTKTIGGIWLSHHR